MTYEFSSQEVLGQEWIVDLSLFTYLVNNQLDVLSLWILALDRPDDTKKTLVKADCRFLRLDPAVGSVASLRYIQGVRWNSLSHADIQRNCYSFLAVNFKDLVSHFIILNSFEDAQGYQGVELWYVQAFLSQFMLDNIAMHPERLRSLVLVEFLHPESASLRVWFEFVNAERILKAKWESLDLVWHVDVELHASLFSEFVDPGFKECSISVLCALRDDGEKPLKSHLVYELFSIMHARDF